MNLHSNDLSAFEERLGEEGTATDYFEGVKKAGLFGMSKGLGIAEEYAECMDEDCDLDHDRLGSHTDASKAPGHPESPWPLPAGAAKNGEEQGGLAARRPHELRGPEDRGRDD